MIHPVLFFIVIGGASFICLMLSLFMFFEDDKPKQAVLLCSSVVLFWVIFFKLFDETVYESEQRVVHLTPSNVPYIEHNRVIEIGTLIRENLKEGDIVEATRSKPSHPFVYFPYSEWSYKLIKAEEN